MSRLLSVLLCLLVTLGSAQAQHAIPFIPSTVVTGPASATSGNCASFNGTTGKIIQDAGTTCGGTSSFTKIQTLTASTSASLDFTSLNGGTYNTLLLDCNALVLSSNDDIRLVYGEGVGPTWQTAATYLNQALRTAAGTTAVVNTTTAANINLTWTINVTAGQSASIKAYVSNVISASLYKVTNVTSNYWDGVGTIGTFSGSGAWHGDTNAITGLRVITSGGATINTGQCTLYGLTP